MIQQTRALISPMKKSLTDPIYISFFKVATAGDKHAKIFQLARHYFFKKEPLLFFTTKPEAIKYTSLLLWAYSKDDFLPHTSDLDSPHHLLFLGDRLPKKETFSVFNLEPGPLMIEGVRAIYEFDDSSTPNKATLSKKRYNYYSEKGCAIQLQ